MSDDSFLTTSWRPIREVAFEILPDTPAEPLRALRSQLPPNWRMTLSIGNGRPGLVQIEGPETPGVCDLIRDSQLVREYALAY